MSNTRSIRLIFFGIGLIAVFALTGMNVYSLYELRESTIETAKDNKKNQIEEFTSQVRYRFSQPFRGIRKLDIEYLQYHYLEHEKFPENLINVIAEASRDSIFGDIYFSPHDRDHCVDSSNPLYKFDADSRQFIAGENISELVCDGLGLARSRMKVLIDDYRWNNKVTFDTHRSMTLSMINLTEREVIGHLTFTINRKYFVDDYLAGNLAEKFGPSNETGIVVWLRDFMLNDIIAKSDDSYVYDRDMIEIHQRFPNMLDNWVLHAKIVDSPTIAASNASFTRNLIVLGSAVLALFGALIFMFITAKRERELAQRQSGFLANITHEFKTPLATMQAAGENLFDGRVMNNNSIKTYGNHIYNETIRLGKMIEKLLDIARLDSGESTVKPGVHNPGRLLQTYYDNHYDYVTSKGFTFELDMEHGLPDILLDPDHFESILINLTDNALKYSFDKKHITLKARQSGHHISFIVTDRGIGIPGKAQKKVFEKFYRLEDSMTAKTKGHGLGLSIVNNLVRLNHGSIDIESRPGLGTSFIVTFPVHEESARTDHSSALVREPVNNDRQKPDYVPN
ncbi:MAG: HAMP domain-containing sensor histidine kinase [Balneolaceae bacterium]